MTKDEHLLTIAAEECNEVAQRIIKALRFGMDEVQPGQPDGATHTNGQRIWLEYFDLLGMLEMLAAKGILPPFDQAEAIKLVERKKESVLTKWAPYAIKQGTIK